MSTHADHARRGMTDAVAEVHGWPREKHRPMCLCEIHRPGQGLCDCAACKALRARRRVLALIATEAPGQDVAGVCVIDDALRIDFVSGAALLVGADGTLSWVAVGRGDPACTNPACRGGWVERGDDMSDAPCLACNHDARSFTRRDVLPDVAKALQDRVRPLERAERAAREAAEAAAKPKAGARP